MKTKRSFSIEGLKLYDDADTPGGGEGYASTFDTINSYGDCIRRGAFAGCLADFRRDGFVSFGHDWDSAPIATVTEADEDSIGLFVRWEYHSTDDAQAKRRVAQERLQRGKTVGLSIGFEIASGGYDPLDPAEPWREWSITQVSRLYEFSIVNAAADPRAVATRIQSAQSGLLDGLKLADLTDALLADAGEIVNRYAALHEMRNVAEGRKWSENNRERLAQWRDRAEALSQSFADLLVDPEAERLSLLIDLDEIQGASLAGV